MKCWFKLPKTQVETFEGNAETVPNTFGYEYSKIQSIVLSDVYIAEVTATETAINSLEGESDVTCYDSFPTQEFNDHFGRDLTAEEWKAKFT